MKKIKLSALALVAVAAVSCGEQPDPTPVPEGSNPKIGMLCLHDSTSTYDKNFQEAFIAACKENNLVADKDYFIKSDIPESADCRKAAKEWAEDGFHFIFSDSYGHQDHMLQASKDCTSARYCSATGDKAKKENRKNYYNAFAKIYEGRYLTGIAAGKYLEQQINAGKLNGDDVKIGYVGAYPYAEVVSGYTSFYLGVKSVINNATMLVTFTDSWYDYDKEKAAAQTLIGKGCKLISQHADSMGAPEACENNNPKIPNVSYNISNKTTCPGSYLIASKINWKPYFNYAIGQLKKNEKISIDYCGDIKSGSVELCEYGQLIENDNDIKNAVETAKTQITEGKLHIFDTSKFTYGNGKKLESLIVDNVETVKDGYFHESDVDLLRSAPYFSLGSTSDNKPINIDGITNI